jgi:YHS domain-containing protein
MKGLFISVILAFACGAVLTPEFLAQQQATQAQGQSDRAVDPVCHLSVVKNPELSVRYRGEVYYFCTKADMEAFRKNPEKYLRGTDHSHPDPAD